MDNKNFKQKVIEESSKIKDINVQLHNYSFHHFPTSENVRTRIFIVREKIIQIILEIINESSTYCAAYF